MNGLTIVVAGACVFALAYRYYGAFLAAKVLVVDPSRRTPAVELNDGQNYVPTNKWVLFGHQFAAISGAGPLVGPVLAAQFGYLPGFLWILIGAVVAGGVHDFVILFASTRRKGLSVSQIAKQEVGPVTGVITGIATFSIINLLLAALCVVIVNALYESSWGVFTLAMTIPIALFVGIYMRLLRPGRILEGSLVGFVLVIIAVGVGPWVQHSRLNELLLLSPQTLVIMIATYAFFAAVLPVWLMLVPRDYISSYMKVGVIALLALGTVFVAPKLNMPAVTQYVHGGGPIIPGTVFPYVFITIACGALSGFHSLISSGTTPKMIANEAHLRFIGYGAMLMEGFVALMALVAATVLMPSDYFAINVNWSLKPASLLSQEQFASLPTADLAKMEKDLTPQKIVTMSAGDYKKLAVPMDKFQALSSESFKKFGLEGSRPLDFTQQDFIKLGVPVEELAELDDQVQEHILSRPGGAVSLAVGMTHILGRVPGLGGLMAFLYHFAIMFEALFILTSMDAGTRVSRYLLQELLGMAHPRFRKTAWLPGALICGALVTLPWAYLAYTGTIKTLWPLFGISNQLLACIALVIGTTILIRAGKLRYIWVTLVPMVFVLTVTFSAAAISVTRQYIPEKKYLLAGLAVLFVGLSTVIVCTSLAAWWRLIFGRNRLASAPALVAEPK